MKKKILVALHDAGGAAAIAPMIGALQDSYECRIFAYDTAAMELRGYNFQRCESLSQDQAQSILQDFAPSFVLSGTSAYGETIDRAFIGAAKALQIPTMSVLDYWLNYRMRFSSEGSDQLDFMPDQIAVMNEDAKREMVAEGVPEERIIITGSPRFQGLSQNVYDGDSARQKLAQQYGLDVKKPWVLYLSQPFSDYFGGVEQARQKLGYTEQDSADLLISAIGKMQGDMQILARLHPREHDKKSNLFVGGSAVFVQDSEIDELIASSDIITGMSTVALIDAYIMRKPVLSIQPCQSNDDLCYLTRCGLIPKCKDTGDVLSYLGKVMAGESFIDFTKGNLTRTDASVRVMQLIGENIR